MGSGWRRIVTLCRGSVRRGGRTVACAAHAGIGHDAARLDPGDAHRARHRQHAASASPAPRSRSTSRTRCTRSPATAASSASPASRRARRVQRAPHRLRVGELHRRAASPARRSARSSRSRRRPQALPDGGGVGHGDTRRTGSTTSRRRKRLNRGTFISRAEIERKGARIGHRHRSSRCPGVRLVPRRGGIGNQVVMTRGDGARPCVPQMFVHNMPYSGTLDDFIAEDIEAVEVYVGHVRGAGGAGQEREGDLRGDRRVDEGSAETARIGGSANGVELAGHSWFESPIRCIGFPLEVGESDVRLRTSDPALREGAGSTLEVVPSRRV